MPRLFDVLRRTRGHTTSAASPCSTRSARAAGTAQAMTKRAFDIAGAALAPLAALSPILALVALAIRLDDGGPVIFRATACSAGTACRSRISQVPDADGGADEFDLAAVASLQMEETIELVKRSGAIRPTRVGRLLRRASIDELPQLWNVLAAT